MPERDPELLIGDMLGAAQKIARSLARVDRQSFLEDEKTVDAVVRNPPGVSLVVAPVGAEAEGFRVPRKRA